MNPFESLDADVSALYPDMAVCTAPLVHPDAPLYMTADGTLIVEAFRLPRHMQHFISTVADPITRPALMHEYRISTYSLYTAVSMGWTCDSILSTLQSLCKTAMPESVVQRIRATTRRYGKVRIILDDVWWLEVDHDTGLHHDDAIAAARVGEMQRISGAGLELLDLFPEHHTATGTHFGIPISICACHEIHLNDRLLGYVILMCSLPIYTFFLCRRPP